MNTAKGIALVSALIVSAVILAFGLGSIYLANMNEGIADGQRSHAIARSSAEAGMQVARLVLAQAYTSVTPNQLPEGGAFVLPTSPDSNISYTLINYTPVTDATSGLRTQAQVVVQGTGPRSGLYRTEALLGVGPSVSGSTQPGFPVGLVSEAVARINGSVDITNADVHGNQGFELYGSGSFENCPASGSCLPLIGTSRRVTGATGMGSYSCTASGTGTSGLCAGSTPTTLVEPKTIGTPPYSSRRDTLFGAIPGTCDFSNATLGASYPAGSRVCITGSVSISDTRSYSNITLVVEGNFETIGNLTLNNVNIVATGSLNTGGNLAMSNSRIYADGIATLSGNATYTGTATIASGSNMTLYGNVEHTFAGNDVGMLLMAAGNFSAAGNMEKGVSGGILNANTWAGGTASIAGNLNIKGGIASVGNLLVLGSATVDGRGITTNPDAPQAAALVVDTLSRR